MIRERFSGDGAASKEDTVPKKERSTSVTVGEGYTAKGSVIGGGYVWLGHVRVFLGVMWWCLSCMWWLWCSITGERGRRQVEMFVWRWMAHV